ncbi:MAG: hypothetical protein MK077_08250 [Phycisphaerales bacterium]|nr:hypothetical protein [Phycisphaerales bacterium]
MIRSLSVFTAIALTVTATAQTTNGGDADPMVKLRALETMNETAASNLSSSLEHEKELREYIKSNGLESACASGNSTEGAPSPDDHDNAMSFDKALEIAIKHEQIAPSNTDVGAEIVDRETTAYMGLARTTWGKLQASMASVEHMSECLKANGKFEHYRGWSNDQAHTRQQEMDALNAKISQENQAKAASQQEQFRKEDAAFTAAMAKRHQQFLNTMWNQHKFESNQALKAYKYSSKYGQGSYYNSYGGDRPSGYGGGWGGW